jgi:Zn-dependent peptidase ImmA (M78 family)
MLTWAIDRARLSEGEVRDRFPDFGDWLAGTAQPTLKQLEKFAQTTHAAIGFFFGSEPPDEPLPIPDYRTLSGRGVARPSPDLLDTLYLCQQRQEWYRQYALTIGEADLDFVGSLDRRTGPTVAAARMRVALQFEVNQRTRSSRLDDAVHQFTELAENLGVLVMVNGVVGSNNNRKLDIEEFRGFAISDALAPVVFINGSDSKSAQMFTLAHELAHLWLGESALTDATIRTRRNDVSERWCNEVAAELLVPLQLLEEKHDSTRELTEEMRRLSGEFKVSTLVVLRRLHDMGAISSGKFRTAYDAELSRLLALEKPGEGGGNFYNTTVARVGRRFARAIIGSALEGRSSFTEALHLLGFKKMSVFTELGHRVGVSI